MTRFILCNSLIISNQYFAYSKISHYIQCLVSILSNHGKYPVFLLVATLEKSSRVQVHLHSLVLTLTVIVQRGKNSRIRVQCSCPSFPLLSRRLSVCLWLPAQGESWAERATAVSRRGAWQCQAACLSVCLCLRQQPDGWPSLLLFPLQAHKRCSLPQSDMQ